MMRLRFGNEPPLARSPGSSSESSRPRAAISSCSARCAARIGDVDAGAQHRDGAPARSQRGAMRDAVDAARHPADDAGSRARERARELARHALAVRRRASRADDRDARLAVSVSQRSDREQSTGGGSLRSQQPLRDTRRRR